MRENLAAFAAKFGCGLATFALVSASQEATYIFRLSKLFQSSWLHMKQYIFLPLLNCCTSIALNTLSCSIRYVIHVFLGSGTTPFCALLVSLRLTYLQDTGFRMNLISTEVISRSSLYTLQTCVRVRFFLKKGQVSGLLLRWTKTCPDSCGCTFDVFKRGL